MNDMAWTWITGIVIGGILMFGGLSSRVSGLRASTKQLIAVMGFFAMVLASAILLDNLLHWWSRVPREIIGIIGILIVIERTFRVIRSPRQGGAMVLDLGRVPVQDVIINLFLAAGLAWFAVSDIVTISHLPRWTFQYISFQILGLSLSYAVAVQGLVKRKIMEHGLCYGTGFSRWEKFDSYDWERESVHSSTLLLHKRSGRVFTLLIVSIKAEHVQEVEAVLEQRGIARVRRTSHSPVAVAAESSPTGNS
jgi:hypothetical protein